MRWFFSLFLIVALGLFANADKDWSEDKKPEKWNKYSRDKINHMLGRKVNGNLAKNVILFLGDGMGISTVTAGRILKGQINGKNGEEEVTVMESLDHVALSKTYNIDAQTADSAGTATAFLTGVKTRIGVLGLDGRAIDCPTSKDAKLDSILKWAYYAGKSTGIVTTTRVTHATPGGAYCHSPDREWEAYDDINFGAKQQEQGCKDIAAQLVEDNSFINVIFAGGRRKFLRKADLDYAGKKKGDRTDGRNLIDEWNSNMQKKQLKHKFLWNLTDFNSLKPKEYDHILGLLNVDHMDYELDRVEKNPIEEPSLINMTNKAIELLSTNPNGFFLLVEGGKIDHGHHNSLAQYALADFVVLDGAVDEALHKTSEDDTLIVVSADHSHVFTIGGYAIRGNDLFDINLNKYSNISDNNLTYTPLIYGNGPGGLREIRKYNLTREITRNKTYTQESAVYLSSETHGGEDVAIYANGPMSYLFDGTVEQSYIAHVMAYSACIGPYNSTDCKKKRGVLVENSASQIHNTKFFIFFTLLINIYLFV